jgi:hypothetical protein
VSDPLVVGEDDLPDEPPTTVAGPQSPLELLRGKRPALDKTLFKDLCAPRWGDVLDRNLWIRYGPSDPAFFAEAMKKREEGHLKAVKAGKHGDPAWMIKANADLLVNSCVAIFDLALEEEPPAELVGEYPTFGSPELAEALGAQPGNAVRTVLKVYGTDADILIVAQQLLEWSGQASQEGDKSFLANSDETPQ